MFPRTGTSNTSSSTVPLLPAPSTRPNAVPIGANLVHGGSEDACGTKESFLPVSLVSEDDSSMRQLPLDSGTSFAVLGMAVPLGRQSTEQLVDGLVSLRPFCSPFSPHTAEICPRVLLEE